MPLSRTRRIAKWTGLVLSAVLFMIALASVWFYFGRTWRNGTETSEFIAWSGSAEFRRMVVDSGSSGSNQRWLFGRNRQSLELFDLLRPRYIENLRLARKYGFSGPNQDMVVVTFPLWLPLLAIAIPTAWLWWRDRRHPPGHCRKCGYDLAGNESGVCSECGEAI